MIFNESIRRCQFFHYDNYNTKYRKFLSHNRFVIESKVSPKTFLLKIIKKKNLFFGGERDSNPR